MYRIRNRSGMGIVGQPIHGSVIDTGAGTTADCNVGWQWALNSGCWKYSPSAWSQMAQFAQPPSSVIAPPPAVDAGTSTVPAPYKCSSGAMETAATNCPEYSAAVDASLAAGKALTDQAMLDWYAVQSPVLDSSASGSTNWLLYAGIALAGVFALSVVGGGSPRRYGR
jgi:hypothetical protein